MKSNHIQKRFTASSLANRLPIRISKTIFYSPRLQASSVTVTIDDEAYTDFTFNEITGRLKLITNTDQAMKLALLGLVQQCFIR